MARYTYAFEGYNEKTMARAIGRDLSISPKVAIEVCNNIRGRSTAYAKKLLQDVLDMARPIRFTRFTNGLGHKKGNGASGRYPQKASAAILNLIESAEKNAQQKGLNTTQLKIVHIAADRATEPMHYGRQRGVSMKRAHVSIVIAESKEEEKKSKKGKKSIQEKKEVKAEPKKEEVKVEKKETPTPKSSEVKAEVKEEPVKKIEETKKESTNQKPEAENTK